MPRNNLLSGGGMLPPKKSRTPKQPTNLAPVASMDATTVSLVPNNLMGATKQPRKESAAAFIKRRNKQVGM
jgi:hypothetical protein